jgi:hypothetical protein
MEMVLAKETRYSWVPGRDLGPELCCDSPLDVGLLRVSGFVGGCSLKLCPGLAGADAAGQNKSR